MLVRWSFESVVGNFTFHSKKVVLCCISIHEKLKCFRGWCLVICRLWLFCDKRVNTGYLNRWNCYWWSTKQEFFVFTNYCWKNSMTVFQDWWDVQWDVQFTYPEVVVTNNDQVHRIIYSTLEGIFLYINLYLLNDLKYVNTVCLTIDGAMLWLIVISSDEGHQLATCFILKIRLNQVSLGLVTAFKVVESSSVSYLWVFLCPKVTFYLSAKLVEMKL